MDNLERQRFIDLQIERIVEKAFIEIKYIKNIDGLMVNLDPAVEIKRILDTKPKGILLE